MLKFIGNEMKKYKCKKQLDMREISLRVVEGVACQGKGSRVQVPGFPAPSI